MVFISSALNYRSEHIMSNFKILMKVFCYSFADVNVTKQEKIIDQGYVSASFVKTAVQNLKSFRLCWYETILLGFLPE